MEFSEGRIRMKELQTSLGYSKFWIIVKEMRAERLQVDKEGRGQRRHYRPAEYKKLYHRQHGICQICDSEMAMPKNWPGDLEMDHIDPNSPDWDAESNRQVTHGKCNREKSSSSIQEQSRKGGKTFTEIIR